MKKKDKQLLAIIGGTIAAIAAAAYFMRNKFKAIYNWDETIYAAQGHPFTVRVPRGEYSVSSPDLIFQAQNPIGTETHVVMVAPAMTGQEYTIKAVLVEEDTSNPYPIEVRAVPLQSVRNPPGRGVHIAGDSAPTRESSLVGGNWYGAR